MIVRKSFPLRSGFTLVELLAVVLIISILAGAVLMALRDVREVARNNRTKTQIARINDLVIERYESYITHPVRLSGTDRRVVARARLKAIRELMRKELPDRKTDVTNTTGSQTSMLWNSYRRKANAGWTVEHEGAECLYLILSTMSIGETGALDFFKPSEVGDLDGDGMPEILDAWGTPIQFIRWAPGFTDLSSIQVADRVNNPDPFDQLHADPRWASAGDAPYRLTPLVMSAGPDKVYDIKLDPVISYSNSNTNPKPDPYAPDSGDPGGTPNIADDGWADNITNHNAIAAQ